ncbi:multidrug transporter [Paenibacillus sp. Root52]|uniref:Drug/metabolite transporter (DMT)-like permease n=1 Tax=Paenibacillus amylolyticus TaxID=1451 RepID=A0AAP5H129_PAEAM|nr:MULTISPECIES: DMT family transporter [Paenibacillus]KQY94840.1 multidrug transporter [Paenibacillus sp. Root52]MDR6723857.1 drug/metabolite transporter (DMT)-like permease [Paenibacillus amylolyticus]
MKYYVSVLAGAMSYGILSTIVVLAYGEGYKLGEVVGTQLITGFILSWMLALYTRFNIKRKQNNAGKSPIAPAHVFQKLTWKQRLMLMAAGTPTVITGLVYYQSLRYIPASLAIILLFQFTWISVLIQAVSKRQRPNKVTLFTLVILFGGTLLAAGFLEQGLAEFNGLGIALGLMAAVSYSLFVLFSGKAVPSAHPAFRSAWMVTGGLVLLCILFPPTFLFNGLIWSQLLVFGLLLGFFGAFIPPVLFAIGVPHIGGDMAGILGAVELPVAVLLSAIVLHEHVSVLQWFGVIVVLLGVALPELHKLRVKRTSPSYS